MLHRNLHVTYMYYFICVGKCRHPTVNANALFFLFFFSSFSYSNFPTPFAFRHFFSVETSATDFKLEYKVENDLVLITTFLEIPFY